MLPKRWMDYGILSRGVFLITVLILSLGSVSAYVLIAEQDARVYESAPSSNFGSASTDAVATAVSINQITYFYLNWSNLTDNYTGANIRIRLDASSGAGNSFQNVSLYYCDDVFNESTITWNNRNTEVTSCNSTPFYSDITQDFMVFNSSDNYLNRVPISNFLGIMTSDSDKKGTIKMQIDPLGDSTFTWFTFYSHNDATYHSYFELLSCTPDWVCSGYAGCNASDLAPCNAVTDNNACGVVYGGDYSEFVAQPCDYCVASLSTYNQTGCVAGFNSTCIQDANYASCCAVTGLVSDCPQNASIVCYSDNCTVPMTGYVAQYTADDASLAAIDGIVRIILIFGAFAVVIAIIFLLAFLMWYEVIR